LALGHQNPAITQSRNAESHAQTLMAEKSFLYQTFAYKQTQGQDLFTTQQIKGTHNPVPLSWGNIRPEC